MNVNSEKIDELVEKFLSGFRAVVRQEVRKLNKLEFYYLVDAIRLETDYAGIYIANNLVGNVSMEPFKEGREITCITK